MAEKRPELDKRLQEMHTSQMTESAVNVEFLEWLKKWGLNILLVFLLILVAIRGYWWLQESRDAKRNAMWAEYSVREIPSSLVDLADEAEGVGALPELALRKAARTHYATLIRQESLEASMATEDDPAAAEGEDSDAAESPDEPEDLKLMPPEERADLINQIDRLYTDILERTEQDEHAYLLRWEAMMSLAAVAEMRGEAEQAGTWYGRLESEIAARNTENERYEPWLREVSRRQETLAQVLRPLPLPRAPKPPAAPDTADQDAALQDIQRQLIDAAGDGDAVSDGATPGPLGPIGPLPGFGGDENDGDGDPDPDPDEGGTGG